MIITVKNLQQQTFTVEFESEKTVLELKQKIFKERGPEYVVEKQKLIYAGVILSDERTIASYNVDEKKFVVVMLKRDLCGPPSKPDESGTVDAPSTSSSSSRSSSETTDTTKKELLKTSDADKPPGVGSDEDTKSVGSGGSGGGGAALGPVDSNTSILSGGSAVSVLSGGSIGSGGSETSHSTYSSGDLAGVFSDTSLQSRAESNLLMGEEYNRTVESMIEMGYSRELVERAMAASFNNPERAVEYLISGIPETEDGFNAASAAAGESALLRSAGVANSALLGGGDGAGAGVRQESPRAGNTGIGDGNSGRTNSGGTNTRSDGPSCSSERGAPGTACTETASEGGNSRRSDPFEFLRNQPQFLQMRTLVTQNPDLLNAVLQQIGETNPALLQLISENQDAFLSMMNQPVEGQQPRRMTPGRRAQLAAAERVAAGGDGPGVRPLDVAPGAGGDGAPMRTQSSDGSGDAGADTITRDMQPPRPDYAAERRAAAAEAFMRERAAAAAAVAELIAAASDAVDRDANVAAQSEQQQQQQPRVAVNTGGEQQQRNVVSAAGDANAQQVETDSSGVTAIHLTQQDFDAIERLRALGFPEALVLQAYFACNKDEQLAANFLISAAFDD